MDDDILIIRILFASVSCFAVVILYVIAYSSACLEKASHSPYSKLNGIIAKLEVNSTQLNPDNKMKMNSLIERLAQTEITVWCLDLFALNHYELYLFITAIVSNFMLIADLTRPS